MAREERLGFAGRIWAERIELSFLGPELSVVAKRLRPDLGPFYRGTANTSDLLAGRLQDLYDTFAERKRHFAMLLFPKFSFKILSSSANRRNEFRC